MKKKAPKQDTSAQDAALEMQRESSALLDEEENRRRKRLLAASTGARAFAGSAMFRRPAGNTAGRGAGTAPSVGGAASSPGARGSRGGSSGYLIP